MSSEEKTQVVAASAAAKKDLPPVQICVRRKEGWQLFDQQGGVLSASTQLNAPSTGACVYSPCGRWLASMEGEQVSVWNAQTGEKHADVARRNISGCLFSPQGTFLVTFEVQYKRGSAAADAAAAAAALASPNSPAAAASASSESSAASEAPSHNLFVWEVATMTCKLKLFQKEWSPNNYGYPIQWTADEARMGHLMTGAVTFYDGKLPLDEGENKSICKLYMQNILQFSLPSDPASSLVAAFAPGSKGQPSVLKVYRYPDFEPQSAVITKSIFLAERVDLKWNARATHLIMLCHTEMDATGQSYGGGTQLFFFATDASFAQQIKFQEEGQVQAVEWNPKGSDFIVIHGRPPYQSTLFSIKECTPIFEFGNAPVNMIRFSPHGRFVMLGGFGNLPGHMQFWDKNKLKKLGQAQHHSARAYEWAPDGRSFMTAVVHPFRRVDNCYKIWKYNGDLLTEESCTELYQASFRPAPEGTYPDRPQSPKKKEKEVAAADANEPASSSSSTAGSASSSDSSTPSAPVVAPAAKPSSAPAPAKSSGGGSYVPPHLRNKAVSSVGESAVKLGLSGPASGPRRLEQNLAAVAGAAVSAPAKSAAVAAPVAAPPRVPVGMGLPLGMAPPPAAAAAAPASAASGKKKK